MDKRITDARVSNVGAMLDLAMDTDDPVRRAQILAEAQPQLAWALRAAVDECQTAGHSWADIGNSLGMPRETVFRQHRAGGPIVTVKPYQSADSPNRPKHQTSAIYCFQDQAGNWFGPHDALPDGEFETGTLHIIPTFPNNPNDKFADQKLTVRYGHIDNDVSHYTVTVRVAGQQDQCMRVTYPMMELLFEEMQGRFQTALTAVARIGEHNDNVDPRLRTLIAHAASTQAAHVSDEDFWRALEALAAEADTGFSGDRQLDRALRRLSQLVKDASSHRRPRPAE